MALSAFKTYSSGEILTASDLNSSFSTIHNNANALISPFTANVAAGGFKVTGLGIGTSNTDAARVDNANAIATCEFRLSLTTGVPVTTADVLAAETLYFTPCGGNKIALYDGTNWVMRSSTEMSIDVPDVTGVHDVFCYDNAGTPTLEALVWTNETTRATALTTQNGVLVKTGALTRRYVGTFYSTTAGNGQIEDSFANRFLWNYYNRRVRPMRVLEGTDTWTYTLLTIRQANGAAANQLNFVVGVNEDPVNATVAVSASNTSTNLQAGIGIGLDSTTDFTSGYLSAYQLISVASRSQQLSAFIKCYAGVGKHYLSWNEFSEATGTTTWYGDGGNAPLRQSGIHGEVMG